MYVYLLCIYTHILIAFVVLIFYILYRYKYTTFILPLPFFIFNCFFNLFYFILVGLSNICHTLLINIVFDIPSVIFIFYNAWNILYFSFGLFQPNGFIGKLLYSLFQCLNFSLKSSKLTNILS